MAEKERNQQRNPQRAQPGDASPVVASPEARPGRSQQRGIQSVEVGGALLKVLAEADSPLALTELARRAGLPAAKAHPYLVSYGHLGLIVQDRGTGHYDFGPLALGVGLAALRRLNPLRLVTERLPQLVAETGHTAAVAVWGNHGATVVHIAESNRPLHINLRAGTVMSLVSTATGLIFAAHLPAARIAPALAREGLAGSPTIGASDAALGPASVEAMHETAVQVRQRGLARTIDRPVPGVSAMSAPVFDHLGSLALAVTLLGPSGVFDASWDSPLAISLATFAREASAAIGAAR